LICDDRRLSDLDEQLDIAYRQAINQAVDKAKLQAEQRHWLLEVRDGCSDVDCLLWAYEGRINGVRAYAQLEQTTEAQKQARLRDLLTRSPPTLSKTVQPQNRALCMALLSAFVSDPPEAKLLEPDVRTMDWSHPAFREYNRCHGSAGSFLGLGGPENPRAEAPYRLYRKAWEDKRWAGLQQDVLYVQGLVSRGNGFYMAPNGCKEGKLQGVAPEGSTDVYGLSTNALLRYKGEPLAVEAWWSSRGISIGFYELFFNAGPDHLACLWIRP